MLFYFFIHRYIVIKGFYLDMQENVDNYLFFFMCCGLELLLYICIVKLTNWQCADMDPIIEKIVKLFDKAQSAESIGSLA